MSSSFDLPRIPSQWRGSSPVPLGLVNQGGIRANQFWRGGKMSRNQGASGEQIAELQGSTLLGGSMYEISQALSSSESQKTSRTIRFSWQKSVPNYIWVALVAIICVINPNSVRAQTSYGSVVGTVTDSVGAIIAGRSE